MDIEFKKRIYITIAISILVAIIFYFSHTIYINFIRVRDNGELVGCNSNLKNIGDDLDKYAVSYDNRFPQRDSEDFKNIVNSISPCRGFMRKNRLKTVSVTQNPYCIGYEVDLMGYRFTLCCKGENHKEVGVNSDYPKYTSIAGLQTRDEDEFVYKKSMPIYTAVYENSPARVKELLATKPDLSKEVDTLGRTPLHTAAAFGYTDIAEMLIVHGVDINSKDRSGWTPLKWAKSRNRTEMAKLLKKHGANE